MTRPLAGVLALAVASVGISSASRLVEVGQFEHKMVETPGYDGDLRVSVKVPVENTSDTAVLVQILAQAVDADGFELFDVALDGTVAPGEVRELTNWLFFDETAYRRVVAVNIEDIDVAPIVDASPSDESIRIGEAAARIVEPADAEGDVRVSVRVTVRNRGVEDRKVKINVRATDGQGFAVDDVSLQGVVRAGETRYLTDTLILKEDAYESITDWTATTER